MARSLKKGPYVDENLLKKIANLKPGQGIGIKTWARDATITPEMVGFLFLVHNGKDFIQVQAQEEMVGHRLGEFAPTTKFTRHGGRMQREIEAGAEASTGAAPGLAKAPAAKPAPQGK